MPYCSSVRCITASWHKAARHRQAFQPGTGKHPINQLPCSSMQHFFTARCTTADRISLLRWLPMGHVFCVLLCGYGLLCIVSRQSSSCVTSTKCRATTINKKGCAAACYSACVELQPDIISKLRYHTTVTNSPARLYLVTALMCTGSACASLITTCLSFFPIVT